MKNLLLAASVILNTLLIAALGLFWSSRTDIFEEIIAKRADRLISQFNILSNADNNVVMLGDSLTEGGLWQELMPGISIVNRGIGGDTTEDVLNRLDQILAIRPNKLFIMIGINDLNKQMGVQVALDNYLTLFNRIDSEIPETKIYLQSVLPINDEWHHANNKDISTLNDALKEHAQMRSYVFIDLHTKFSNQSGKLRKDLSNDGIHLLGDGYELWRQSIESHVMAFQNFDSATKAAYRKNDLTNNFTALKADAKRF